MHKILVPQAGPAAAFVWVPALIPDPSSACTRVLCMHKSVVHAQECCACTRILCLHKNLVHIIILKTPSGVTSAHP